MNQRLSPCLRCARHVRVGSSECPFCAAFLPPGFEEPIFVQPARRLGRAAVLAFRTLVIGAAGVTTGCGAGTGLDLSRDAAALVDAAAIDSGAPGLDAGRDAGSDAGLDSSMPIAMYGGPIPEPDAGFDSGPEINVPTYGAPAPLFDAGADADAPVGYLYGAP